MMDYIMREPLDSTHPLVRQAIDTYVDWIQAIEQAESNTRQKLMRHLETIKAAWAAGIPITDIRNYPEPQQNEQGETTYVNHYYAIGYFTLLALLTLLA